MTQVGSKNSEPVSVARAHRPRYPVECDIDEEEEDVCTCLTCGSCRVEFRVLHQPRCPSCAGFPQRSLVVLAPRALSRGKMIICQMRKRTSSNTISTLHVILLSTVVHNGLGPCVPCQSFLTALLRNNNAAPSINTVALCLASHKQLDGLRVGVLSSFLR